MNPSLRLLLICAALTVATALYTASVYPGLPDQIPVHFNASGMADRWQPKGSGAWITVSIMAGLAAMFAALPLLSPKTKAIEPFRKTYDLIAVGTMVFMAILNVLTLSAAGNAKLSSVAFGLLMCGLFGFLGNLLGKVTPNYYVGIRTPWTLESPENWERTHRFAARSAVVTAAIGAAIVLLGGSVVIAIVIATSGLVMPVGYSYWLYAKGNKMGPTTP
ncbi:MAG: SdpI family protein [Armatimonadetes bacterium]|nr:SdpI family protein [Armatimonadota bacterium]MBX3109793.1 SdpI family protein [Fimbriimonadaceae bacterium]